MWRATNKKSVPNPLSWTGYFSSAVGTEVGFDLLFSFFFFFSAFIFPSALGKLSKAFVQ